MQEETESGTSSDLERPLPCESLRSQPGNQSGVRSLAKTLNHAKCTQWREKERGRERERERERERGREKESVE